MIDSVKMTLSENRHRLQPHGGHAQPSAEKEQTQVRERPEGRDLFFKSIPSIGKVRASTTNWEGAQLDSNKNWRALSPVAQLETLLLNSRSQA